MVNPFRNTCNVILSEAKNPAAERRCFLADVTYEIIEV